MRNNKNIFAGIMFLVIAVFVIVSAMGVFGQIGFWTLVFTPFLVAWFVVSICKVSFGGVLFSLAFFAVMYDEMLGIERLTPWPVLLAAMFGSIGLKLLFDKRKNWRIGRLGSKVGKPHFEFEFSSDDEGSSTELCVEMEHYFKSDECFSEVTKYINCQALRKADISNSFGSSTIYFDGAVLDQGHALVNVDNSFGHLILYIPKTWQIKLNVERSFGNCEIFGEYSGEGDNILYVSGETSFGEIEIFYI